MKILKKTAFIFKEKKMGNYTILLSHPVLPYSKHSVNRHGLPVMYIKKIYIKKFIQELTGYKFFFRRPQAKTIKSMQWTLLLEIYLEEKLRMLLEKPFPTPFWPEAVNIYWHNIWVKAGIEAANPAYERFYGMKPKAIYTLLVLENKQILLN